MPNVPKIYKGNVEEFERELDNQDNITKLATELDNEIIDKIISSRTSASGDTIAIPRGMIEELVKLAESAHHDNIDTYKNMVVGAVILLRAYLSENSKDGHD